MAGTGTGCFETNCKSGPVRHNVGVPPSGLQLHYNPGPTRHMNRRCTRFGHDRAEEIAIDGLSFLAGDGDRLGRFLALTGFGPPDLANALADPAILAAVLEHIVGDEAMLLELSANRNLPPDDIVLAWDLLVLEVARRTRQ